MNEKYLVIYHGGECWDGLCSAWLLRRYAPWGKDAEYVSANYGDEPPDVTGKHVMIVDFSWPRDVLIKMHEQAASLMVLDHHKTAQAELEGLPFAGFTSHLSGVGIVWNWLLCKKLVKFGMPLFAEYIQDRDLWKWEMVDSRQVSASMRSFPCKFQTLDQWAKECESGGDWWFEERVREGGGIMRRDQAVIDIHVKHAKTVNIHGVEVPIANATTCISEVCQEIAKVSPTKIGASYFIRGDGACIVSLRSTEHGPDVSELAKRFPGGGGHKHAAGFTSNVLWLESRLSMAPRDGWVRHPASTAS